MKTLVIDDHFLIRDALRGVLGELQDDMLILEASDSDQAIEVAERSSDLDLILLDLFLPETDCFGLLVQLRKRFPMVAVVVHSANDEHANIVRAFELGAVGFIPKSASRDTMLGALRMVVSGGVYVPPQILLKPRSETTRLPARPFARPSDIGLTGRHVAVLAGMMKGKSNKAIGHELDLAEPTVKNHVTSILKVLKVSSRVQAVIAARELGLELPGIARS